MNSRIVEAIPIREQVADKNDCKWRIKSRSTNQRKRDQPDAYGQYDACEGGVSGASIRGAFV